jgi:hypothetical protein
VALNVGNNVPLLFNLINNLNFDNNHYPMLWFQINEKIRNVRKMESKIENNRKRKSQRND